MPSFVQMTGPGTATITDDAAVAITAQTAALEAAITAAVLAITGKGGSVMEGSLSDIANKLNAISGSLAQMVSNSTAMAASMSKVETATAATASAARQANNIQLAAVTDQVTTNEFQKQVTKEALTRAGISLPVLPDFETTIKEKIKEASSFRTMMKVEGMVNQALEDTTEELQNYFKQMAKDFGITKYIQDKIDSLKALVPDPKAAVKFIQSKTIVTSQSYGGLG
jgi:hypothetical protein